VVAESRYIAEDAADLVIVEYEPMTPVVDYITAESSPHLVHEAHGSNLIGSIPGRPTSELEDIFAAAAACGQRHDLPAGPVGGAARDPRAHRPACPRRDHHLGRHADSPSASRHLCPAFSGYPSTGSG
jgi:CO/xanthine dehydrogenase Mo-binding subunit